MALFAKKKLDRNTPVGKPKAIAFKLKSGVVAVPVVSEKASRLQQQGQYTFNIVGNISKVEIKKAVESAWGVRVLGVNSIGLPGKIVRRGRQVGQRKARRHLVVRLARGESIDLSKTL